MTMLPATTTTTAAPTSTVRSAILLRPPTPMFFTTNKMKSPMFVIICCVVILVAHCCTMLLVSCSTGNVMLDILGTNGRTTELRAGAQEEEHRPLDDYQQQQHRSNSHQQQQRPYFIFHLGPHKTGTSEIQCELSYMRRFLKTKFNVTYIGKLYKPCLEPTSAAGGGDGDTSMDESRNYSHYDQSNVDSDSDSVLKSISTPELVECLDKYQYGCHTRPVWKQFRSVLEQVRYGPTATTSGTAAAAASPTSTPQHILMSDEKFSRIRLLYRNVYNNNNNNNNETQEKYNDGGIRLLYETVAEEFGYEIKLVFVYRHYYAWFYSLYNEIMKKVVLYKNDVRKKGENPDTTLSTWGRKNVLESISETDTTVTETKNSNQSDVDGRNEDTILDIKNLHGRRQLKKKKKKNRKKTKPKVKPGTPVEPFVEYYRRFDDDRRNKNHTLVFGGDGREEVNLTEQASSRLVPQYLRFSNQQQIHPVSFLQRWWTLQGSGGGDDDDEETYLPYVPDPKRGDVILINMHESEIPHSPSNAQQPQDPRVVGQTGDLVIDFIRQALAPLQLSPSFIENEIIKFKRKHRQETEDKTEYRQQKHRQLQIPSKTNPSIDLNYDRLTYTAAQDGFRFVPEHVMRNFRRDVVTRYTQNNFLSFTKIDASTIPLKCLSHDEIQDMCDVSFKMMTQLVDEKQANELIPSASMMSPTSSATVPLEGKDNFITKSTPSPGSGRLPPLFQSSSPALSSSLSATHDWSDHHNRSFVESFVGQKKNHCQWDVTMFLKTSQAAKHFFRSIEPSHLTPFLI